MITGNGWICVSELYWGAQNKEPLQLLSGRQKNKRGFLHQHTQKFRDVPVRLTSLSVLLILIDPRSELLFHHESPFICQLNFACMSPFPFSQSMQLKCNKAQAHLGLSLILGFPWNSFCVRKLQRGLTLSTKEVIFHLDRQWHNLRGKLRITELLAY